MNGVQCQSMLGAEPHSTFIYFPINKTVLLKSNSAIYATSQKENPMQEETTSNGILCCGFSIKKA